MLRETAVFGVLIWRVPEGQAAEIHAALDAGLETGTLRPVIAAELPLSSASEAHPRVMKAGALGKGKIVLIPSVARGIERH
jgi:NADPH:quinone reductase-like Zn-dependent oxidoreductase